MANYTEWLEQIDKTEEGDFNELLHFIESNSEHWPKDSKKTRRLHKIYKCI